MKSKTFVVSAATATVVGLALTGCSAGGSANSGKAGDAEPVVGKAVKVDLTKDAVTKSGLVLTDTDLGDKVEVKQISTKFDPTNLTSFKSGEGDIVMVQVKVSIPEDGFSVSTNDFGLKDEDGNTSSDLYAGGLEAAMDAQGFPQLPSYVEQGSVKTGWVPLQIQDTAKSAKITWKRDKQKDYSSGKTYPARTLNAPLFTNTGAEKAVTAAKEGATPKTASATSTDPETQNTVKVDQIITNFPLPASMTYETGHVVAIHVTANAGSVYTAGWSPRDVQLVTKDGSKVEYASDSDLKTALAEKGFQAPTDSGYISSGESTDGWLPFIVKPKTEEDGFKINQHRDAANIIGGGSLPAADFPADITIS